MLFRSRGPPPGRRAGAASRRRAGRCARAPHGPVRAAHRHGARARLEAEHRDIGGLVAVQRPCRRSCRGSPRPASRRGCRRRPGRRGRGQRRNRPARPRRAGSRCRRLAPISTLALSSAPVLRWCMSRKVCSSSAQADARQIDRLAAGHAGVAGGARQQRAQPRLQRRRDGGIVGRQHLEGQRLHRVAGEHRLGLAEAARARSACPGAARRCPCTACRRAPANRHGSARPRTAARNAASAAPCTACAAASTSSGRSRLPPSSTP